MTGFPLEMLHPTDRRINVTRLAIALAISLISLLFAFTSYYWVSVLLLIVCFSIKGSYLTSWVDSLTSRLVVNSLLFGSVLTLSAMGCWLLKVAVLPILPIAAYAILALLLLRYGNSDNQKKSLASWEDALAIGISCLGIIIFILSFYIGHPQTAGSIQSISNGFDNSAHLNLVEADHFQQGFVLGSYAATKQQVILPALAAYPQGWHFITAFIFTDMGNKTTTPAQFINAYVMAMLAWQFISIYLFTRASLYLAHKFMDRHMSKKASYIGLVVANLLFQIIIFWGNFYLGFASFTAVVSYMLLLTGFLLCEKEDRSSLFAILIICLSSAAAVSLSWPLEGPVAFVMIALRYMRKDSFRHIISLLRDKLRGSIVVVIGLLSGFAFVFASFVQHRYSGTGTGDLLNANGGIYGISDTLVIIVYVTVIAFIIGFEKRNKNKGQYSYLLPAIICPSFLLALAIYFFQSFTTETVNYYFVKTLSVSLLIVAVFFSSICAYATASLHKLLSNYLYLGIIAVVSMMGMVAFNGQGLTNVRSIARSKAVMSAKAAQALADNLQSTVGSKNDYLVVFRQALPQEDVMGSYLAYNVNHNYNNCINQIRVLLGYDKYSAISQMNQCAKTVHLTVITSNNTYQYIKTLNRPNIKIINIS